MRARTRAVAVTAGAALVVVPLTGAAAAALVSQEDAAVSLDAAAVHENQLQTANDIASVSTVVAAPKQADYELDVPSIDVEADPEPVVVAPEPAPASRATTSTSESRSSGSTARPVAQSSAVKSAVAGSSVLAEAAKYVGTPYRGGGASPGGFDCSGFVSYVYGKLGVSLPRSSGAYYSVGTRVSSPQPGDIIVTPGHVGIYAGPNLQIDSPRPGKTIQFRSIWQSNPTYVRVS